MSKLRTYNIGLEIEQTDKSNATFKALSENFKSLNQNLNSMSMENLNTQINTLSAEIRDSVKGTNDASKALDKYNAEIKKSVSSLEKEAESLQYMLTTQGRADRERLAALKAKQTLTKEESVELKKLQKTTIQGTDEEIKKLLLINRQKRIKLKTSQLELKESLKESKTLKQLISQDLSGLKQKIKLQQDFIKSLKTTEGRYNALKKVGKAVGVGVLGVGGALVGGGIAAVKAGVDAANSQADKDKQKRRMKGGLYEYQKDEILSQLRIATGKSYSEIVDAVNRVTTTIRSRDTKRIISATQTELEYPGSAELLQGTNKGSTDIDFVLYRSKLRAIQKLSGATDSTIEAAQKAAASSSLARGKFSQSEFVAMYSALKESGAFKDDSKLELFLRSFMRQADVNKPIFGQLRDYMNNNIQRFVYGQQDRNRAKRAVTTMDIMGLDKALSEKSLSVDKSDSERTQEQIRELEEKKEQLLIKFIPLALKVFDTINKVLTPEFIKKVGDFIETVIEFLTKIIEGGFKGILDTIKNFFISESGSIVESVVGKLPILSAVKGVVDTAKEATQQGQATTQKSSGGLITAPSLVGERGAELVIPLDYSRQGRSSQIINNFTQSFNLTGNQTTALSLGQAVKSQSFARQLQLQRV